MENNSNAKIDIRKIESLKSNFKKSLKVFGPIGAVSGFISDVITPIAPVIDYLAIILVIATLILSILYFLNKVKSNQIKLAGYLPNSIILTSIIGAFSLMGFNTDNGFFGDNFDSVSSFQQSIFNIEKGVKRIEGKVDNMQSDISDIKNAVTSKMSDIDNRLYEIEKKISNGSMINNPSSLEDFLINAMISYNLANYKETELMLERVFNEGYLKYDLVQIYYEVLLNNYNGDIDRIRKLIKNKDFAKQTNYFEIADIEANIIGVKYYNEIEKIKIQDPLFKAFIENSKAKSFYSDEMNYMVEGYATPPVHCKWTKIFLENKKLLGPKLLKAKSLFFNYTSAYKRYLINTSYTNDENAIFDFYAQQLDQACPDGKPEKSYVPKY